MANAQDIMQKMRAVQKAREEAFVPLADVLAERAELRQKLAELDAPYSNAYAVATAAGWTPEELATIGAEEPAKRPKGRPRTRPTAAQKGAAENPSGTPVTSPPAGALPPQANPAEDVANVSG